jgi:hypothetical protein
VNTIEIKLVENSRSPHYLDFRGLPFRIYRDTPQWVPWFHRTVKAFVDRKHPLFEHSCGDFYVALRQGRPLGRIFVLENTRYNETHNLRSAHFLLFDTVDEEGVVHALLRKAVDWGRKRGLEVLLGPMGLGGVTGGGLLIEGFEHRAAMTMMNYNHAYYQTHIEAFGFEKYMDNFSFYLPTSARLPSEIEKTARQLEAAGRFKVLAFRTKGELARIADQVVAVFLETLGRHVGNYLLSRGELETLKQNLLEIADPRLLKIITCEEKVIGFLFGFHDLSAAIQKSRGRLHPLAIYRLMRERKKADWLLINGLGILPDYQGTGANFLLYAEIERAIRAYPKFKHLEMVQIQETTAKMLSNVETLRGRIHKTHRIYRHPL